jgi:hypothetical protein
MSALTASFLNGWRSLPVELKTHILNLIVTFDTANRGLLSYHHLKESRYWNQYPIRDFFVPLTSIPEIKDLVLEAFYTQNKFLLEHNDRGMGEHQLGMSICLPPKSVQCYVRMLHFSFGKIDRQVLKLLGKASKSLNCLHNLSFLEISFSIPIAPGDKFCQHLDNVEKIGFPVKYLRIEYLHYPMGGQGLPDTFETMLLEKFTLKAEVASSKTTWKRLSCDFRTTDIEKDLREVDAWPATTTAKCVCRWTVKEVITPEYQGSPYPEFAPNIPRL